MGMNYRFWILMALLVAISVSIAIPAWSYEIKDKWIKPGIPDVNKPDLDPTTPGWQMDNSCAVASTTNMLWAAGYRYKPIYSSGSWSWSVASSADALYSAILGTADQAGFDDPATYGWLYTQQVGWMNWYFQHNTNEAANLYKLINYKEDFSGLTLGDRDFLYRELKRCQYVELGIGGTGWYHSTTLVGWFTTTDGYTGTYLHDSDRTAPSVYSDDPYLNGVYDSNRWALSDYTAKVWGYKTLCPIPEPATLILLGSGLLGFGAYRLKRKKSKSLGKEQTHTSL